MTAAEQACSPSRLHDPLHYEVALPLRAEYFPMGRSLRVHTNQPLVLTACEAVWSRYPRLAAESVLRLHIEVDSQSSGPVRGAPVLRAQEHLVSIVEDARNFVSADLRTGFAFAHFTKDRAADAAYLLYHFLEPTAYLLAGARYFAYLHASCVSLNGRAVVLCGDSGAGKTCLAFACANRGWTFHSGDATGILLDDPHRVAGRPFEVRFRNTARDLFPELSPCLTTLRPNGKYDIEINPVDLNLSVSVEAQASHIVILQRSPGSASLTPAGKNQAYQELSGGICFGDQVIRERQSAALSHFLDLPAWRFRYSDINDAEQMLRSLVNGSTE